MLVEKGFGGIDYHAFLINYPSCKCSGRVRLCGELRIYVAKTAVDREEDKLIVRGE